MFLKDIKLPDVPINISIQGIGSIASETPLKIMVNATQTQLVIFSPNDDIHIIPFSNILNVQAVLKPKTGELTTLVINQVFVISFNYAG